MHPSIFFQSSVYCCWMNDSIESIKSIHSNSTYRSQMNYSEPQATFFSNGSASPRLRTILGAVAAAAWLAAPNVSVAQTTYFSEGTKTVAKIGVQNTNAYIGFVEGVAQNCRWGYLYISPDRKVMYTQFLAAKISNKRLSRVDYSQPGGSGTQCFAEIVELSE